MVKIVLLWIAGFIKTIKMTAESSYLRTIKADIKMC